MVLWKNRVRREGVENDAVEGRLRWKRGVML